MLSRSYRAALLGAVAIPCAAAAQDARIVEEIVVTARKRQESILEIPVSVSAFSQDDLERAAITNPADLSNQVAGFDFEVNTGTSGRTTPDIRFRGQVQQVNTPSTQIGAVFWDGSYMGAGSGFIPFGDLERVEVIKGPQTAYFGRNTFSGAINYIPRLPGDTWSGKVEIGYSPSYVDKYNISGAVGGPITEKLGVRVFAGYTRDGGDFKYGDGQPLGQTRDTNFSGTATLKPSDSVRLKVSGYYTIAKDTGGTAGILATVPGGQCRKTVSGNFVNVVTGQLTPYTRDLSTLTIGTFCGTIPRGDNFVFPITRTPTLATVVGGANALQPVQRTNPFLEKYGIVQDPDGSFGGDNRAWRVQGGGEIDLPGGHVFETIISWSETGTAFWQDGAFGTSRNAANQPVVVPSGTQRYVRENYVEGRVTSPQEQSLRYLFGISKYNQHFRQGAAPVANTLDFQNNNTFGVFGGIDYDIMPQLTLSAEGRYAEERSLLIINGNPAVPCGLVTACNLEDKNNAFIPRIILTYRPWDGVTTYASWSRGKLLGIQTQAGFISSVAPTLIPDPSIFGVFTPPQINTTYEIGWKQRGDWWSFTLAGYFTEWENQPFASVVLLPVGSSSFRGPGSSESWGAELEFAAEPTDWLSLSGTLGWVDAKLTSYASRGTVETAILNSGALSVAAGGNEPRYVPEWSASFGPTIHGSIGERDWYVRADLIYSSDFWVDFVELDKNPGAARINLRGGIDVVPGTTFELYATNLTNNKRVPTGATTTGPGGQRVVFTEVYKRRTIGARVRASF